MEAMEDRYRFSRRIAAERMSMRRAHRIITSTDQERREQYAHPLYAGAVDVDAPHTFKVQSPGVNTMVFDAVAQDGDDAVEQALAERLGDGRNDPHVLVSSRLDEKKNIIGVVEAFTRSASLRDAARLAICIRGIDDPFADIGHLPTAERGVLRPILDLLEREGLRDRTVFLNVGSQRALAATYRRLAARGSVFALTAFYEPFGLAPIEAAACGLACVATRNGGPSEIFADGSGVLVDPFDADDIARGLLDALARHGDLSAKARSRVARNYTWKQTARGYLDAIAEVPRPDNNLQHPDASERIQTYLMGLA